MKKVSIVFQVWLTVLLSLPVDLRGAPGEMEVSGVSVPKQVIVEGIEPALVLNGAGIRTKFFFKIYVAALYLPVVQGDALKILKELPANRMSMNIVYDELPREKLINAWIDGFENNIDEATFSELKPHLMQFNQMFKDLHRGDVVLLDYLPDVGTRVSIADEMKGVIEGADFNRALLSVWLGDDPVTDELKSALLGLDKD